jgi:hypothetical protein
VVLPLCSARRNPRFSGACKIAIQWGTREIIRSDWKKVFERAHLEEAIAEMLQGDSAGKPA